MGDHVLVKWASEEKWDVYCVKNIKYHTVVSQLVDDPKYVTRLTNQAVQVLWQDDEYAPAYILGIGGHGAEANKACVGSGGSELFRKTEGAYPGFDMKPAAYTCSLYKVSVKEIRTSLSSMLARGQVAS
ncbi:hypothetical protein HPB52_024028 [Rhipicephalus sanguineus]|uniref:Uncharacterized protein n=1 Tax=Rhipicephalus sanguineus TaxID=34632 RepID=A0A9D4PTB4_RHISA|nr:hypothetical protein HPB52_024028 [Rhipicephalus sanguineus]